MANKKKITGNKNKYPRKKIVTLFFCFNVTSLLIIMLNYRIQSFAKVTSLRWPVIELIFRYQL